ncbi:MAG: MTAP family purine nucleoside phosphorylase [Peptococcaceae bacterium]|nr:MTAP family purine nucleoside phosphorylase [Peptococcaceae bacterium]
MREIPRAELAVIGGSGTYSINFPGDLDINGIEIIDEGTVFKTPFGDSPPVKFFRLGGKTAATVKMHGWRPGVGRGEASRQVFWVFREAGVRRIIAEGGVGSVNHLLRPRDLVIPSDYIDLSMRRDVSLGGPYLLVMRQPVCPDITSALVRASEKLYDGRVFDRGVYAVTDGRHFESRAEVVMLGRLGADVVGQSMCPEVYLAREIGACYGRLDLVVNYAEGVIRDWDHGELKDIFYGLAGKMGAIVMEALGLINGEPGCGCRELRKETLLK